MTRSVGIVLVLAAGMALALAGSLCATRAGAMEGWLRRRSSRGTAPSETAIQLTGAALATAGIFVAILAAIAEIWWLQGVKLP